jgi:hypothetical protein
MDLSFTVKSDLEPSPKPTPEKREFLVRSDLGVYDVAGGEQGNRS